MVEIKNDTRDWAIYKITSPTGRVYIGKSTNIKSRISSYRRLNCLKQPLILRSLKKYGFPAHAVEVIDNFNSDFPYASGKEMFWIRSFMSNNHKFPSQRGMNLTDGGEGLTGYKTSDETKKKQSLIKVGKPPTNKGKTGVQSAWNKGLKMGISAWNKGIPQSEEARKKNSEAHKGHTYNRGRKYSEEIVEKMRIRKRKKILQYGLGGEFIRAYDSRTSAIIGSGMSGKAITHSLKGRGKRPTKFIFKYKK